MDLSAIPSEQMEALVGKITDSMLVAFDELMETMDTVPQQDGETFVDSDTERVLWEGRPFLSIGEYYILTTERIKISRGLLSNAVENIELIRLQDVDYTQTLSERMINIGDIKLHSANPSNPEFTLHNVGDPAGVHDAIRRAMLDARKRHAVGFREEI